MTDETEEEMDREHMQIGTLITKIAARHKIDCFSLNKEKKEVEVILCIV